MSLPCLINAEFLQVQDSFGQGAEAGFVVYFKKKKKGGGETPETAHMVTDKLNEVRGGENLPSGVAEEHNSLWPCHEGAHLQTCRQEEKGQQPGYSTWTQLSLI